MVPADSLAALVGGHLSRQGLSIAEAARRAGMSYRQLYRIVHNESTEIQARTIERLETLGIPRADLALAAYGRSPQEAVTP